MQESVTLGVFTVAPKSDAAAVTRSSSVTSLATAVSTFSNPDFKCVSRTTRINDRRSRPLRALMFGVAQRKYRNDCKSDHIFRLDSVGSPKSLAIYRN